MAEEAIWIFKKKVMAKEQYFDYQEENFHGIKLTYTGHMSLKPDQQNISHQHLDPHLALSDKAERFVAQPVKYDKSIIQLIWITIHHHIVMACKTDRKCPWQHSIGNDVAPIYIQHCTKVQAFVIDAGIVAS